MGLSVPGDSLGQNIADIPGDMGHEPREGNKPLSAAEGPEPGWALPAPKRESDVALQDGEPPSSMQRPSLWGSHESFSQPRLGGGLLGCCPFVVQISRTTFTDAYVAQKLSLAESPQPRPRGSKAGLPTPSAPSPPHLQERAFMRTAVSSQDERSALHACSRSGATGGPRAGRAHEASMRWPCCLWAWGAAHGGRLLRLCTWLLTF